MDFLMKLYLMNFVHQQQSPLSASLLSNPSTLPLAETIANSNFFQQIFLKNALETMQNISNDSNTNNFSNQMNNYLFPSTVISTPSSSFDESDFKNNISAQHGNSSTNNFSTPSSISSNDKSSILADASSTLSPLGVRIQYKCVY